MTLHVFTEIITCCRSEREKYAKHRHKSEKYPSKYLSLIIDGMDQDKTDIPHIISNPKAMAGSYTLETHITGVRAHGHCTMMVIDWGQFHHDTNLTIEILLRVFNRLKVTFFRSLHVRRNYMHVSLYTGSFATSVVHADGQHMQGQQEQVHPHLCCPIGGIGYIQEGGWNVCNQTSILCLMKCCCNR